MNYRKKVRLGDLLVQKGIITEEQLGEALKMQKEKKMMLGEMIVTMGFAHRVRLMMYCVNILISTLLI
mgnify:CR=1 FL=1